MPSQSPLMGSAGPERKAITKDETSSTATPRPTPHNHLNRPETLSALEAGLAFICTTAGLRSIGSVTSSDLVWAKVSLGSSRTLVGSGSASRHVTGAVKQ